jgi:hypothetical protein
VVQLNGQFHGRWIGRGRPIQWPTRSPDVNPIDFFSWQHLMGNVRSRPTGSEDKTARLYATMGTVKDGMLQNVFEFIVG